MEGGIIENGFELVGEGDEDAGPLPGSEGIPVI